MRFRVGSGVGLEFEMRQGGLVVGNERGARLRGALAACGVAFLCACGALAAEADFTSGDWTLGISPRNGAIVSLKWKGTELAANPSAAQTVNLNCADLKPDAAPRAADGEAHGIVDAAAQPSAEAPVRLVSRDFDRDRGVLALGYESGSWRIDERIRLGDGRPNRLSRTVSFRQTKDVPLKFKGFRFTLPLRLTGGYYLPGGFFTDLFWREDNRAGLPRLDWTRRRGRLADYRRGGNDRVKFAFFDPVSNLTVMAFCDARQDGAGLAYRKGADAFCVDWNVAAQGWCEPGQVQSLQTQWLEVVEKEPERALDENAPALLTDLGFVPPKTRPDWVKDAAIYGIENEPFRGERLADIPRVVGPRMRQLGLNTCWYRPSETSTGRYCPIDYRTIEPKIGSADDYRAANEAMHAQGLRVLQDLVPHGGGQLGFFLRGQSCSMQAMTENGDVLDVWSADFADLRWRNYMRETCALYTGDWKTDGFRVDAIYGSKTLRNWRRRGWPSEPPQVVPSYDWSRRTGKRVFDAYWKQSLATDGGEMPPLAYDRASLASSWGGLRMVDAMRAGATSGCKDAALLLECGELPFVAAGDLTYDRDIQSLWFKLRALSPEDFVLGLRTWLHEEQKVDPPDAVRMRYMETGDGESWPYRNWYGVAADRAIRALCAFIDGVPMFFENFTEGEGDYIAMLMRIRREVKALRRGVADYKGVTDGEAGVFAFTRACEGSQAVVAINFSPDAKAFRGTTLEPWGFAVWENGRRVDDAWRDERLVGAARTGESGTNRLEPEVVHTDDGVEYRFSTAVRWELDTAEGLLADTMPANGTPRKSQVVDYGGKRPSVRKDPSRIWFGAENPAVGALRVTDGEKVCVLPIPDGGYNDVLYRDREGKTCLTYLKGQGLPTRTDDVPTGVSLQNASTHWIVSNAFYSVRLQRANGVPFGTDLEADRRLAGGGPYAVASGDPDSRVRIERADGKLVMTFRGEIRAPYAPGANRLYLETRYAFDKTDTVRVDYALTPSGTAPVKPSVAFVAENGTRHDFFAAAKGPLKPRRTYRFGYVLSGGTRRWSDCVTESATNEGYPLKMSGVNSVWIDKRFGLDGEKGARMAWCNPEVRLEVAPDELEPGRYTLAFDVRGEQLKNPAVRAWSDKVSPFHPFVREYTRLDATLWYYTSAGERKAVRAERRLEKEFGWERQEIDFEVPEVGFGPRVDVSLFNAYADVAYLTRFRFSSRWHEGEDETASLQRRIDETSAAGGGRVTLSAGVHRIKPVQLKSGVELHLEEGARLLGSPFGGDYPDIPLRHAESTICPRGRASALVWADEAHDIAVTGPGVLDGNGDSFLCVADELQQTWGFKYRRRYGFADSPPRMCLFTGCRNVRVEGLRVEGLPGGWAFWVHDCDEVLFDGVKIAADVQCANNDGIHVNCSRDVTIRNCDITTGDDAVIVRANSRSLRENKVCERVTVTNCTLRSWSCGVRIGWCNDGVIRNCLFENLKMRDTTFGVGIVLPPKRCIPSDYGREDTLIENLTFRNIRMDGIYAHPLYCRISDDSGTRCAGIRDLVFENVTGYGLQGPYYEGTAAHPFERFVFRNCSWRTVGDDVLPGSERHGAAAKERFREEKFVQVRGFSGTFGKGKSGGR